MHLNHYYVIMRGQQTEYPISLEFGKYVSHSGDCTIHYSLKSVIEHSGNADFGTTTAITLAGHYISVRKLNWGNAGGGTWVYANDESIHFIPLKNALRCRAYILFYERD